MGLLKQSSLDSVRIEEVMILFPNGILGYTVAIKVQMAIEHNYLEAGLPSKGCSVTLPHCQGTSHNVTPSQKKHKYLVHCINIDSPRGSVHVIHELCFIKFLIFLTIKGCPTLVFL